MPPLLISMLFAALAAIVATNLLATLRIIRCDFDTTAQRAAQLAFVWCFPVIGAVIVYFLTRANLESHAGRYPEKKEEPEDVAVAQSDYSSSD